MYLKFASFAKYLALIKIFNNLNFENKIWGRFGFDRTFMVNGLQVVGCSTQKTRKKINANNVVNAENAFGRRAALAA